MAVIIGEDIKKLGIEINPEDAPENIQGASYDLRIGEQVWLWSERRIVNPREQKVTLRRNDIAIVQTYETIKMPATACGIIVNLVSPHAMGVFHPATSIDPLFNGHMQIALFNLGRYDVELTWKKDLATAKFFLTTHSTNIQHKREQDFSELIQVFAQYWGIMYPERLEEVPRTVSLNALEEEIVWRGNPFISIYSFLAGHDKQLSELKRALRNQFLLMMSGPWILTGLVVLFSVIFLSQSWQQVKPYVVVLSAASGAVNLGTLIFRLFKGRRSK